MYCYESDSCVSYSSLVCACRVRAGRGARRAGSARAARRGRGGDAAERMFAHMSTTARRGVQTAVPDGKVI